MSAKWKWGNINIYVTEESISREIKRAELFVLDSTDSIWHMFGSGSEKRSIKGLIIGESNRQAIISDAINDTAVTLTTPWGIITNTKLNGIPKFSAIRFSGGVMDGIIVDSSITPIYECDLEVIQS